MKKLIAGFGLVAFAVPFISFAAVPPVGCNITATPSVNAAVGGPVTLSWTTSNAVRVRTLGFSNSALNGSVVVHPTQYVTVYTLVAYGVGNQRVKVCQAQVKTVPPWLQ